LLVTWPFLVDIFLTVKKCWLFGNPSIACNLASSDKHHLLIFFKKKKPKPTARV